MKWKCGDCGCDINEESVQRDGGLRFEPRLGGRGERRLPGRSDICDECMDRRGDVMEAMKDKRLTHEEFASIQKAMGRRGAAEKLILRLLNNPKPGEPK